MKSKNLFLILIFWLFIFILPSVVEAACPLSCQNCQYVLQSDSYCWGKPSNDCMWKEGGGIDYGTERLGIIGNVEKSVSDKLGMNSPCIYGNKGCGNGFFPSGVGYNGQSCRAVDRCAAPTCADGFGGSDCIKSGVWDASDPGDSPACVSCNGKIEQYVRGDTSAIYAGCSGCLPSGCNDPGNAGDGQCESACGADSACDEVTDGNQCTIGKYCEALGRNCQSGDKCSGCVCTVGPKPDLIITDIWSDGSTIKYTIKNQGNASAFESESYLYVDGNQVNSDPAPSLVAGASSNELFSYYTWTCSGTSDTIKVCADATGFVPESNEGNNCREETWRPDLIISTHSYSPLSPVAGDSMSFTGRVKNQGVCPSAYSYTRLRIDKNNDGTYDITPSNRFTTALNPGATEIETWSNAWTCEAGTHKYQICADTTARVTESKESNNCITGTFTCGASPPPPPSPSPPSTVTCSTVSSSQINVSWSSATGATYYEIYRCQGSTCTPTTYIAQDSSSPYSDTGLSPSTTYRYRVKACNTSGCSDYSSSISTCTTNAAPLFDFSVSVDPIYGSVNQGDHISGRVQANLKSGVTQNVTFSASNLPSGVSVFFNPPNCNPNPTCNSTMTIYTQVTTPTGTYSINICGTGGSLTKCVTYGLYVTPADLSISSPAVTTDEATNVTKDSATLNGTLSDMGGAVSCYVWFEYWVKPGPNCTPKPTNPTIVTPDSSPFMVSPGPFSKGISGLTPDTTYCFEAYTKNGSNTTCDDCSYFNNCAVISNIGSGVSCSTMCGTYTKNSGLCDGSGACVADQPCSCSSIGTDAGGTNGLYHRSIWDPSAHECIDFNSAGDCSTVMNAGTHSCAASWTNCNCQ